MVNVIVIIQRPAELNRYLVKVDVPLQILLSCKEGDLGRCIWVKEDLDDSPQSAEEDIGRDDVRLFHSLRIMLRQSLADILCPRQVLVLLFGLRRATGSQLRVSEARRAPCALVACGCFIALLLHKSPFNGTVTWLLESSHLGPIINDREPATSKATS